MTDYHEKMRGPVPWPSRCHDTELCGRNGRCMYFNCPRHTMPVDEFRQQVRDAHELAALSASGTKSDGSRVRQVDNARSHGEGLQYGPDTTITTGTDAPSIAAKVRDDGNVVNQVETSGRAPHVLLGPSDPTPSQPDERESIARLLTAAKLLQQNAIGCATNHHGHDCELNGLPGWLADTKKDIDAAEDAILAMQAERRGVKS